MLKKEEKNSIIEICPIRNVIARFGNKWAFLVMLVLSERECVRFNELCRLIPDVSSRVLSGTEIGCSLVPFITQLTEWAQTNMKTIVKHRKEFTAESLQE